MSKPIKNHFELKKVCRNAALWYVGSYMLEFIMQRSKWENPDTKFNFMKYMYREYGGADKNIEGTITRVNSMIRIIESKKVEDALQLVLEANDKKLGCEQSKINAQALLDQLSSGKISY